MAAIPNISDIRRLINIEEPWEESDNVIKGALDLAILTIKNRRDIPIDSGIGREAVLKFAKYYAYETYADRAVHKYPGKLNDEGMWKANDSTVETFRESRMKLADMKAECDDIMKRIMAVPKKKPYYNAAGY